MMKEQYTSPEIQLLSFVPVERLTAPESPTIDASGLFGSVGSGESMATPIVGDDVELFF